MALNDKKLRNDVPHDKKIAADIRSRLKDGLLSCAAAIAVAEHRGLAPLEVGRTADALRIRLSQCQLGLFGFPGHAKGWSSANATETTAPKGLDDALRAARDAEGNLSCVATWKIAETFRISRMQAGYEADRLAIPIKPCQLGAF